MKQLLDDSFESVLQKIVEEVRKDVYHDLSRFRPPHQHAIYGMCGYSAKEVIKKLPSTIPVDMKNIYGFPYQFHYIVVIGRDFEDSWKVDPTIDQFGKKFEKFIFKPGEPHPFEYAEHPSGQLKREIPVKVVDRKFLDE